MINCQKHSEIHSLRSKRPFHHSVQVSFSASMTLELGLRRWRILNKKISEDHFLMVSHTGHLTSSCETSTPRNRCGKTMKHILTQNRHFRTRSQDSITHPELPKHSLCGGFSLWQIPILREALLTNSQLFVR